VFRCIAISAIVVLAMTGPSRATVDIWLSTSGSTSGSFPAAPTAVPNFQPYLGGSGSIFIWGRPDSGKSLVNLSLNLIAVTEPICNPDCVTPNAISFTSATVFNPQFGQSTVTRFEYVDDSTVNPPLPIMANRVNGITGLRIYENGSPPAIGIGSTADPGYDMANTSWLIAQVDYDALATGESSLTRLYLQIGRIGLNQAIGSTNESTADCSVIFGDATDVPPLNGRDDREMPSSNFDALIQLRVLPGDADRNGAVEPADYNIWRGSFGSMTQLAADHSGNGIVDAPDYVIWRKYLGQSAGFVGAVAIPEPAATASASFALIAIWALRRRSFGGTR
jgi:hypothetical protein